jgi:hypothetical protein
MECPFCAETVKDEAIACKHCSRDLRIVRPLLLETQSLVVELDRLQRELDKVLTRLALIERPSRYLLGYALLYVVLPTLLLLAAHFLVAYIFNISALYLRIASVIIPLPFGMALYILHKIGFRGAFATGVLTAILSVAGMLCVVGYLDGVPILPESRREWRETFEYMISIALAYGAGNILALLAFHMLPNTMATAGQPNAAAFHVARLLGRHVGEDALRRRARRIQDMMKMAGPIAGLLTTVGGSLYAGLKGILGS